MKQKCYYISFKPEGHDSIPTYVESTVDDAIQRALGIYNHMPFPHEVRVIDSDYNVIVLLVKPGIKFSKNEKIESKSQIY